MELEQKFVFTLDLEEVVALKKILGKLSDVNKKEMGLNSFERASISELYDLLPYKEDK